MEYLAMIGFIVGGMLIGMGICDLIWILNTYRARPIYGGNNKWFKVIELSDEEKLNDSLLCVQRTIRKYNFLKE